MDYASDPYVDEDGEPLMDPDAPSDGEPSPGPGGFQADDDEDDDWRRERSPTPVLGSSAAAEGKGGKPRKRLVKKNAKEGSPDRSGTPPMSFAGDDLNDWEDEPSSSSKKRKSSSSSKGEGREGSGKKEKRKNIERSAEKGSKSGSKGYDGGSGDRGGEQEMKELWDTIAGGDSEDDQEGERTLDDDAFIDDSGIDPADRYYGSDNEPVSAGDHPQGLERLKLEMLRELEAYEMDEMSGLMALQLTMDHCTSADIEVRRVRHEHPEDPSAVVNGRVKGSSDAF